MMEQEKQPITLHEVTEKVDDSPIDHLNRRSKSSMISASFNFINSIVGSGVLGVAYSMRQAGVLAGICLVLLVAWMTDASIVMLIRAGNRAGTTSYQATVHHALGNMGYYLLSFLQFTYPFLALLSYNIILGDNFTKVLLRLTGLPADNVLVSREFIIITGTLLITLPLSLYKHIDRLAKISLFSFVMVLVVGVAIVYRSFSMAAQVPVAHDSWKVFDSGIIQAAGIIAFMFMCHHNTFLIYCSLENPTEQRWARVSHYSISVSAFVGLVFGMAGYALFNSYSLGNVLENFCWDDDLMNVMRILYLITVLFTYPIECFVTREVIVNSFFHSSYERNDDSTWCRHVVLTVVICGVVALLSLLVHCLGPVMALNGTLFAAPLAFILPPVCYIKLSSDKLCSRSHITALIVLALGSTLGICGIVSVAMGTNTSENECGFNREMFYCQSNWTRSINASFANRVRL